MAPRRNAAAWAALTVAGVLLPFAPAVIGLRTLSHGDTDRLYGPLRGLVVEAIRAGRLPLWNPYEGAGKPLFAEGIHSVLHPVSLVGAWVAPQSVDFLILGYLVTAALGAFALARTLGASPPACTGAALAFALSGFSVSMTGNLVFLAGFATLPWVLACARSAGAGAPWGPVSTALATGCAFLAGDTQTALVGLALGTILAADAGGARGAARALAGTVAGVLLAGVQIAATRELLPRTFRSLDLSPYEKTRWALAPGRLLEWVLPGLTRGPLAVVPERTSGEWIEFEFAESVYLGAPLLVVAGLGALRGRRRTGVLLGGAAILLTWLAMGHFLGARQLLDWVPVWNRFRYSEKLMAPLTLALCALGALGIDAFAAARFSSHSRRALAASALAAAAVLLALLGAPDATRGLATGLLGDAGPFYRATLAAGLPHLVLGLGALLAIDRLTQRGARASAVALLVGLASAVAFPYGAHLGAPDLRHSTMPWRLESDSPVPRIAQTKEPLYTSEERQDFVEAYARTGASLLAPSVNVASRVDAMGTYGAFEPRRFTTLRMSLGMVPARSLRRFGVTHVIVPTVDNDPDREAIDPAIEGGHLVQRLGGLGYEVWAVPHRPWAFFPERAVARQQPKDAHDVLLDLIDRGDDSTVVIEAPAAPRTAPGRVLGVERGTESVRIEAESQEPALLVVQDAHWPGWRATIDGEPAELLIADLLVRAVHWPAGRHRLEMIYDPPGVRLGVALSSIGAALVVLLALLGARRRRSAIHAASTMGGPSSGAGLLERTSGGR